MHSESLFEIYHRLVTGIAVPAEFAKSEVSSGCAQAQPWIRTSLTQNNLYFNFHWPRKTKCNQRPASADGKHSKVQRLVFHVNNSIKRYGTVLSWQPLKENVCYVWSRWNEDCTCWSSFHHRLTIRRYQIDIRPSKKAFVCWMVNN